MLQGAGHQPIVLSGGFGGQNAGPLRVDPTRHVAADTGDEPLMLADDLTVYIARDRLAALRAPVDDRDDRVLARRHGLAVDHRCDEAREGAVVVLAG